KDPHKLLCATSDNTKALRKMEFNNKAQINETVIREYIYEAIEVEKLGLKIKPEKHSPVEIPLLLKEAFDANEPLKKAFEALSSGKQKEYCIHINEAKQE